MKERLRTLAARLAWMRERRAIVVLTFLSLVFLLLSLLVHRPELKAWDYHITRGVQALRSPMMDAVAITLTRMGDGGVLALLGGGAFLALLLSRRPRSALLCGASLLGVPLNTLLKELIGRPRPEQTLVDVVLPAIGLSFPSGHAMGATLLYGFLALLAWVYLPQRRARAFWTAFFALLAFGIGLSRVYLGAHWFSDVVGGWTAGLFLVLLLAEVLKRVGQKELCPEDPHPPERCAA